MHIAPSIIVFAAFQRILMAIPVVLYLAFTRYASPNTSHNRIELCFSDGVYQWMNSAGEFCQWFLWTKSKFSKSSNLAHWSLLYLSWCMFKLSPVVSLLEFWTRILWWILGGTHSPSSFLHLYNHFPTMLTISMCECVAIICYLKSLETLLVSYAIAVSVQLELLYSILWDKCNIVVSWQFRHISPQLFVLIMKKFTHCWV